MKYRLHTHHSAGHSPIHRLDPRTKLLVTLLYVVLVVSLPPQQVLAFVIYAGLLSWVIALSQVPLSYVLWRACAVFPITILAACWLPFVAGGSTVSILGGRLELSRAGLWLFAGVAIKSYLGASAAITMISTTPFTSLAWGLRKLGLPRILVDMLTMTHRYLFVLFEEAMRLRRAAAARGYQARWLGQAVLIGRLIGQLFVRSFERAERVYGAMLQRGYCGRMPMAAPGQFSHLDWAVLLSVVPLLLAVRAFLP